MLGQVWAVSSDCGRLCCQRLKGLCAVLCLVAQSCPTLCHPMDCSPLGCSIHGILQARILEWVAISFSRGSSQPRDRIRVSRIAGDSLPSDPPRKPRNGYRCGHLLPAPRPPTHCHEPQVPPEFQYTKSTPCASKAGLRVSQAERITSWSAYLLCHFEGLFFFF